MYVACVCVVCVYIYLRAAQLRKSWGEALASTICLLFTLSTACRGGRGAVGREGAQILFHLQVEGMASPPLVSLAKPPMFWRQNLHPSTARFLCRVCFCHWLELLRGGVPWPVSPKSSIGPSWCAHWGLWPEGFTDSEALFCSLSGQAVSGGTESRVVWLSTQSQARHLDSSPGPWHCHPSLRVLT